MDQLRGELEKRSELEKMGSELLSASKVLKFANQLDVERKAELEQAKSAF